MPGRHLTGREKQILDAIANGRSYKEVAGDLGISVNTVRNHAASIREKLGVRSMFQAVSRARQDPLPPSEPGSSPSPF